jgi:MFS transporter, DHA2 family, multidrug resistance protein
VILMVIDGMCFSWMRARCPNSRLVLIATRALLGIAGATLAPSTLSLIRNMFADPRERTVAISI